MPYWQSCPVRIAGYVRDRLRSGPGSFAAWFGVICAVAAAIFTAGSQILGWFVEWPAVTTVCVIFGFLFMGCLILLVDRWQLDRAAKRAEEERTKKRKELADWNPSSGLEVRCERGSVYTNQADSRVHVVLEIQNVSGHTCALVSSMVLDFQIGEVGVQSFLQRLEVDGEKAERGNQIWEGIPINSDPDNLLEANGGKRQFDMNLSLLPEAWKRVDAKPDWKTVRVAIRGKIGVVQENDVYRIRNFQIIQAMDIG